MKKFSKQVCLPALFAAGAFLSTGAAAAFQPFEVTETVVPGAAANVITSDRIVGDYLEVVTFGMNTFQISILWTASDIVGAFDQIGGLPSLGNGYGMFAAFQGSGTFVTVGTATTFTFNPGGTLDLLIDPNQDTTFTTPLTGDLGFTPVDAGGEDLMVLTGGIIEGSGMLDTSLSTCGAGGGQGINCGSFGTTTSVNLTPFGQTYFTDPVPFYNLAFESGQFDSFQVSGTQIIEGSLDLVFDNNRIPEPSTLALFGLGLLGLAGAARRRA